MQETALKNKPDLFRVLGMTALLSLGLIYAILWISMLQSPEQRTGSDFSGFYSFGTIANDRGFHEIYNLAEQERVQETLVGFQTTPIYHVHVPYIALPASLIVSSDYVASMIRWAAVLLLFNGLSAYILTRTLPWAELTRAQRLVAYFATFLFFPTFSGFMNGQDVALLLLGAALCFAGLLTQQDVAAGLALSLTTVRPQIALFLAVPFLFRRPKVFWGFAAGSALLAILSTALVGVDGLADFLSGLRTLEASVWTEPHALDMASVAGMMRRGFEDVPSEPARAFIWVLYAAGIGVSCLIWSRSRAITPERFGLLALFSLWLVPYSHYHDLTLLLIPLYCILRSLQHRGYLTTDRVVVLPALVSLVLLAGFAGTGVYKYPAVYLVMAALAVALLVPERLGFLRQTEPVSPEPRQMGAG